MRRWSQVMHTRDSYGHQRLERLRELGRSMPESAILVHDIGLVALGIAESERAEPDDPIWRVAIGHLTAAMSSQDFWSAHVAASSARYAQDVRASDVQEAKRLVTASLVDRLGRIDATRPGTQWTLMDVFDLERRAAQALAEATEEDGALACGPAYLVTTGRYDRVARVASSLRGSSKLPERMSALARQMGIELGRSSEETRRLRTYFSSAGLAAILQERGDSARALELLYEDRCPTCGSPPMEPGLPTACDQSCPRFEERNPAYARLEDRVDVLRSDICHLADRCHVDVICAGLLARVRDGATDADELDDLLGQGRRAADSAGTRSAFEEALLVGIRGRVVGTRERGQMEQAAALAEAAHALIGSDDTRVLLGELLTDLGVSLANKDESEAALPYLERAVEIRGDSRRTWENYIILRRGLAARAHSAQDAERALEHLDAALAVIRRLLADDPDETKLHQLRLEVTSERAVVQGRPGGAMQSLLEALADVDDSAPGDAPEAAGARGPDAEPRADSGSSPHATAGLVAQAGSLESAGAHWDAARLLEQALALDPLDDSIRTRLTGLLERHADRLFVQGRRADAMERARRGLMFDPAHAGLKLSLSAARAVAADAPPAVVEDSAEGSPADTADDSKPASRRGALLRRLRGLLGGRTPDSSDAGDSTPARGLLSRLEEVVSADTVLPAAKRVPPAPGLVDELEAAMGDAELKFAKTPTNGYVLSFNSRARAASVVLRAGLFGDHFTITSVLGSAEQAAKFDHGLLRATHQADFFKLCRRDDGVRYVSAEGPARWMREPGFGHLLWGMASFLDQPDTSRADPMLAAMACMSGQLGRLAAISDQPPADARLRELCERHGVATRLDRDGRLHLMLDVDWLAVTRGPEVSFVASVQRLVPLGPALFDKMTAFNTEQSVWKAALDSDDDVSILFEVITLDDDTFSAFLGEANSMDLHLTALAGGFGL